MIIKQVANILFFNVRKLDAIPMRRALDPRFSYLDHVRVDRPFDHPVINDVLDSMANLTDTSGKHKDETKAFLTHLGFPFKKQSADKAKATTVHVSKSRAPKK